MAGILVLVYLHITTNYVAYCDELHISGYAAKQKAKGSSPTDVINKKNSRFYHLPVSYTLQVSFTPINGPASFAFGSRCRQYR